MEPCEIRHPGRTKQLRLWSARPPGIHIHLSPPNPHPTLLEFALCSEILWLSKTMLELLVVKENQLQNLNLFFARNSILLPQRT